MNTLDKFNTNYDVRTEEIWNVIRATPATFLALVSFNFLVNPNRKSLFLLIAYVSVSLSNNVFKKIAKFFYSLVGNIDDKLPILGYGRRPLGAVDCGSFLNYKLKSPKSYGMPSGHSQIAWSIATYAVCYLFYNNNLLNDFKTSEMFNISESLHNSYKYLASFVLIGFAILVSYSRVYIEYCHTLEQVIIGGLLGIFMGLLVFIIQTQILGIY